MHTIRAIYYVIKTFYDATTNVVPCPHNTTIFAHFYCSEYITFQLLAMTNRLSHDEELIFLRRSRPEDMIGGDADAYK